MDFCQLSCFDGSQAFCHTVAFFKVDALERDLAFVRLFQDAANSTANADLGGLRHVSLGQYIVLPLNRLLRSIFVVRDPHPRFPLHFFVVLLNGLSSSASLEKYMVRN